MSSTPVPIFRAAFPISVGTSATSLQDTVQTPSQTSGVFAPQRPVAIISKNTGNTLSAIQQQLSDLSDTVDNVAEAANAAALPAAPAVVQNLAAVASPTKTAQGTMVSLVSVSFTTTDPSFASANIYITGYLGATQPALATNGTTSPISFEAEITNAEITITVQSLNSVGIGQALSVCPTTTVTLGSVTDAPPPPSIAQGLTTTAVGNSFSWNVEGGLLADVISGYNVYRATTNVFPGSSGQVQHFSQPSTNVGTIEFDDTLPSSTTDYFYWVTSVNTSALESTPTSAGTATGFGTPQQVTNLDPGQSPFKNADGSVSELVAVAFDPAVGDPFFDFAQVWFQGYKQNPNWQVMAQGVSPIQFECDITNETVQVAAVAVSANSVPSDTPPFTLAPTAPLILNGVPEAPPFPSIAQSQSALSGNLGWQFQVNVIGGLEGQTIAGYRVYHSESNEDPTPGANSSDYYTFIPQPPTNSGVLTVQETTGDILFYWVSAVSTTGFESELNPVPFVFVDPNAPAPPIPSPVTTTNTFTPTTLLNGWAAGQHVQYQPENPGAAGPTPPGLGTSFGPASQTVSPFGTPQAAYDGNQSTSATAINSHLAVYQGCVWSFAAPSLPSGATVTAAQINITSNVVATSGPAAGQGSIWYSLDGSTWTSVYIAANAARATKTDVVTLPTTQNFANVQVMANLHSHDDLGMNVFEINMSITTSSAAGPGQVVGASISLVSNDVQISFPGLLPTNRTDVTGYDIVRVVHGGGFAHGNVQATLPFVSGQTTYTWSDPQGHDGTFDYYIAAVGTGGIGIPSNVLNLGGANSMIYTSATGAITSVDSLRPAMANADVTAVSTQVQLQNPQFEAGNTGWTFQTGWSIINSPTDAFQGNFCGFFQGSSPGAITNNASFPYSPGDSITASCQIKNISGTGSGGVRINFFNSAGALLSEATDLMSPSAGSSYQLSRVASAIVPPNTVSITIDAAILPASGTETWTVDAFTATIGPRSVDEVADGTTFARTRSAGLTNGGVNYASATHSGQLPYANHASAIQTAISSIGQVQNLGGVTASAITPISNLMPAQAGADVTVQAGLVLLTNPNFQQGNTGWTPGDSSWSIVAGSSPVSSTFVGQFTSSSAHSVALTNNQRIPCSAGAVISAACLIGGFNALSGSLTVRINYFGSSGVLTSNEGNLVGTSVQGGWAQARAVATAPAGTIFADIDVVALSASGTWGASGFSASILANSLNEVPDSGTRFAAVEPSSDHSANHVLSAQSIASGSTILSSTLAAITGFGFSVTAASSADTFRIEASIGLTTGANTITVALVLDGNTGSPLMSITYTMGTNSSVPFFALVSGMSAGSHTLQFYASAGTTANLNQNSVALATRVF